MRSDRQIRSRWPVGLLAAAGWLACAAAWAGVPGPLWVHPVNPRYFDDGTGRAIYLTGSHNWWNLQDGGPTDPPAATDYTHHLDFLTGCGHNFTRGWAWEQASGAPWTTGPAFFAPLPFLRTGPGTALDGKPKFDLTAFNQAYFDRVRARAIEAGNRGLYMSIMLFQGWSLKKPFKSTPGNPWPGHPFNQANNINGINGDPDGNNDGVESQTLQVPAITAIQEAYVRKMIDTLNDLDSIFWEISNESHQSSVEWQYHMIDQIHAYEATRPKRHLVWMTGGPMLNPELEASPAEVLALRGNREAIIYQTDPPAATGNRIIMLDTDHIWGIGGDRDWVWKCFTRGYHPVYMDPIYHPFEPGNNPDDPLYVRARRAMGDTLRYANRMSLADMLPQASTATAPASTRFCLFNPGTEYLVLQPISGGFTMNLPAGSYDLEWYDPVEEAVAGTGTLPTLGSVRTLTPPFAGMAVLYIRAAGPPPTPGDLDLDGDVDQTDFGHFQRCFAGPLVPYEPGCELSDLDLNSTVDQLDAAVFLNCAGGPNQPPGC